MLSFIGSAPLILKRQELKLCCIPQKTRSRFIMLNHRLWNFLRQVPKAAWQGIRKEDIEPAQEYYSDDIIVDFDLLDRDAYEEKVCGGAHSDLPMRRFLFW